MTVHKAKDWFRRLQVQISLYFIAASLILIAVLGGVLYGSLSGMLLDNELNNTVSAVRSSGSYIESYIERLKAVSRIIGQNPDTLLYLSTLDEQARSRVMRLITTALETDPALVSVVLVSKRGDVLSNEAALDMTVSSDMMDEAWYVAALNNAGMPALTSARLQSFSMEKSTWVISVSMEILDAEGANAGVLLMDIRYEVIENYLADLKLGKQGFAFILDDAGNVVYHPEPAYFVEPEKKEKLQAISRMADGYDSGMGMLTHHEAIGGTRWTLVGLSSLDDLGNMRRQLAETFVAAALVLLGIILGGGVFLSRRITNPIKALEAAMQEPETELARVVVDERGCYEAASLARHYNAMLDRIEALLVSISEKEKVLRTYEINALHGQINPHFLYNTLDTIVWMAEFNDSEKVIAVTKSLAQFFRLSLSQGEELIPLADELDHVRQYLYIQKQRYGSRMDYSFEAEEELLSEKVPKIILQPLVENAIYHGIREQADPGHITISARREEGQLILMVADTGVGFEVGAAPREGVRLGGVGLSNVEQRIKLHFGEAYGLQIASAVGKGTTVTLRLPLSGANRTKDWQARSPV